jgi:hypothetical protein
VRALDALHPHGLAVKQMATVSSLAGVRGPGALAAAETVFMESLTASLLWRRTYMRMAERDGNSDGRARPKLMLGRSLKGLSTAMQVSPYLL